MITVVDAPDDDRIGAQGAKGGESRAAGRGVPDVEAHADLAEDIGVGAEGDERRTSLGVGDVIVHQQHCGRGLSHKSEVDSAAVGDGGVAGDIGRFHPEIIGPADDEIGQFHLVPGGDDAVCGGAGQGGVGVESRHGIGGFIGEPCDDGASELVGDGDLGDQRRMQIGGGGGDAEEVVGDIEVFDADPVAMEDLELGVVDGRGQGDGHASGEGARAVLRLEHDGKSAGFGGAAHPDDDGGLPHQIGVDHLDVGHARRAIRRPVEQDDAGFRRQDVAANDEGEILIRDGSVATRVLRHDVGDDAHPIIASERHGDVDALDVVEIVEGGRVRHGFAEVELVSVIDASVGGDDFEIQVVDQGGQYRRKAGIIRIGHGDLQGPAGGADDDLSFVNLAIGQGHGLVNVFMGGLRRDDPGQVHATPAFIPVGHRARAGIVLHVHSRIDECGLHEGR